MTNDGELIIFHKAMLERIQQKTRDSDSGTVRLKTISAMSYDEVKNLDITENHPLG